MKTIFFICEGDEFSQSSIHRCFMISKELQKHGYSTKTLANNFIFKKGIPNFFKQLSNWILVLKYRPDVIFLHRSSNLIDYYMVKAAKKNSMIIFDYDDALFHVRFPGRAISYSHLDKIITVSDAVTAGSHYLVEYASHFNKFVHLIPTPVDTDMFRPFNDNNKNKIVIGWLGSGTNYQLRYLRLLKEPLQKLGHKFDIKFKIVSALSKEVRDEFENQGYEVDYGLDHWVHISETPNLISDFDVGVMPLIDEPFARGKCAMKALEYMAMGVPVVASAVGENNYVIHHNKNGYLASNSEEWYKCLSDLIEDEDLRKEIGFEGLKTVKESYSLDVCVEKLISILN